MRQGVIYKVINIVNGKIYIGQSVNFKKRKLSHLDGYRNKFNEKHSPLHCAMRKYGIDQFEWHIIWEGDTNLLDEKEIYYINKYNSLVENGFGYNVYAQAGVARGKNHPNYKNNVYEFYHKDVGIVKCTVNEFRTNIFYSSHVNDLIIGKAKQIHGWIMYENINNYYKILRIYKFYHSDFGIEICTQSELMKKYNLKNFHLPSVVEFRKSSYGWTVIN